MSYTTKGLTMLILLNSGVHTSINVQLVSLLITSCKEMRSTSHRPNLSPSLWPHERNVRQCKTCCQNCVTFCKSRDIIQLAAKNKSDINFIKTIVGNSSNLFSLIFLLSDNNFIFRPFTSSDGMEIAKISWPIAQCIYLFTFIGNYVKTRAAFAWIVREECTFTFWLITTPVCSWSFFSSHLSPLENNIWTVKCIIYMFILYAKESSSFWAKYPRT